MPTEKRVLTLSERDWINHTHPSALLQDYLAIEIAVCLESKQHIETLLEPLGTLIPQYGGKRFWEVKASHPGEGTSIGDQAISLHTELVEFPKPPEYIALYCIKAAPQGGDLILFDSARFIRQLSASEKSRLSQCEMTFAVEDTIGDQYGSLEFNAPILSQSNDRWILRFDQDFIDEETDPHIRSFQRRLAYVAKQEQVSLRQKEHSLLIWENGRVLHGRTGFDSSERLLWRCCIKHRSE